MNTFAGNDFKKSGFFFKLYKAGVERIVWTAKMILRETLSDRVRNCAKHKRKLYVSDVHLFSRCARRMKNM